MGPFDAWDDGGHDGAGPVPVRRAVAETAVVIEGGATNKSFVLDLLDQPEVIDASADTGWIDRVRAEGRLVQDRHSGVALVAAGIEAYEDDEQVELARGEKRPTPPPPPAPVRTAAPTARARSAARRRR